MVWVLAIWALAVAIFDVRLRRVPNFLLVLVAVPTCLMLIFNRSGPLHVGAGSAALGLAVALLLLLPGYLIGSVGAGDVKLGAVLGLLLGLSGVLWALLCAALVLGTMAVAVKLRWPQLAKAYRLPGAVALAIGFEIATWVRPLWSGIET
jgi:prepilin peptidase CpaA